MLNAFLFTTICLFAYGLYRVCERALAYYAKSLAEPSAPAAPNGTVVYRDIEFARTSSGPLLLDIYQPESATTAPRPVVIYIYGGGWYVGNKHQLTMMKAELLAQQGYAVIATSYRLSDQAIFPAQIHDVKATVRWVRANAKEYDFDSDRIAVWGGSAGGHLAALLGTSAGEHELEGDIGPSPESFSSTVHAVVDFFGLSDFSKVDQQRHWLGYKYDRRASFTSKFLGGSISELPGLVCKANPITYIKPGMPPFLIVHGRNDRIVPIGQSMLLNAELIKCGNESTLHIVENAGHMGGGDFGTDAMLTRVREFLDTHLNVQR